MDITGNQSHLYRDMMAHIPDDCGSLDGQVYILPRHVAKRHQNMGVLDRIRGMFQEYDRLGHGLALFLS